LHGACQRGKALCFVSLGERGMSEAIKEQQKEIDSLKADMAALKKERLQK
jgi:hypothetical protein